ncbi:MAG: nucleotide exchange factor GrpE [Pseudomonadota bacterium]
MASQSVNPDKPQSEPQEPNAEADDLDASPDAEATADAADASAVDSTDAEDLSDAAVVDDASEDEQIDWQARCEAETARADEQAALALRLHADMENLRKRAARDIDNAHKFSLEKFANELLPVRDSLEMGLDAANKDDADVSGIREGTDLTLKMLVSAMDKFQLVALDPTGESFDPERHQAMTLQESAEHAPNTVMAVMQKGYTLNDRLLRPALVMVSKAADSGA